MNEKMWDKHIQREEISKTKSGTEYIEREFDLNFIVDVGKINFENKKVLDIGCGSGSILIALKLTHKTIHITGISLNKNIRKKKDFIDIRDMHSLPYKDSSFDIVLIMHTLEHSIAPYIVLSEIKRVLKDKGMVVIIMPEEGDFWTTVVGHYSTMTFRQLFNLLSKLKFKSLHNYRKEYDVNTNEWKRDIIALWENTKEEPNNLTSSCEYITPVKGMPIIQSPKLLITPILFSDNHFLGRTDSLK